VRRRSPPRYVRGVLEPLPVVQARHLVKTFKGRRAVNDISLTVRAGDRVGLLGPNGAGKTTTLLMLLGAVAPDSGDIEIAGLRLPRHRSKAMTRVGFVAGYLPLPENLTVRESLELFAGFAGLRKAKARIDESAEAFNLTELLGRRNQELSSGQRTLVSQSGYYHPTPGDNWTESSSEAVLSVDAALVPEFTEELQKAIWGRLQMVLTRFERGDAQSMVVEAALPTLPQVAEDWRQPSPAITNQARRERQLGEGYPTQDDMVFASRAEIVVYEVLTELQRDHPPQDAFAILPSPSAKMRDASVRTPDFVVLGNGRAVIVEVDGPHHYGRTRKADDEDRDRHWSRCGVPTIRVAHQHTEDRPALKARLREDLNRHLAGGRR